VTDKAAKQKHRSLTSLQNHAETTRKVLYYFGANCLVAQYSLGQCYRPSLHFKNQLDQSCCFDVVHYSVTGRQNFSSIIIFYTPCGVLLRAIRRAVKKLTDSRWLTMFICKVAQFKEYHSRSGELSSLFSTAVFWHPQIIK